MGVSGRLSRMVKFEQIRAFPQENAMRLIVFDIVGRRLHSFRCAASNA